MIISENYKYIFIECPLTASYAIRHELCEFYGGRSILHKHATYPELRKVDITDISDYFVFTTVRNPLDIIVSRYFKLKFDHKNAFSQIESAKEQRIDYSDHEKFLFVNRSDASFEAYFLKYYRRPYSDFIEISKNNLDFVMRYENLQDDFSVLLSKLGIEKVQDIPVSNVTKGKGKDWLGYYTPAIYDQAKRVCGPFMKEWGYDFPSSWGDYVPSLTARLNYQLNCHLRNLYLRHIRFSHSLLGKSLRILRARLLH